MRSEDRSQVAARFVVKERQLVAGDIDCGLELALEQQPPRRRFLVSAEDVLADLERALGAVPGELVKPLVGQVCESRDSAQLAGPRRHASLRYLCTSSTAIDPSPTADATRLIDWSRTSPAAKTPGMLVSSAYGSRCFTGHGGQPLGTSSTCSPVRMNPRSTRRSVAEPVGVRLGADEHEHRRSGDARSVPALVDRDLLQVLLAVRLAHLRPQPT